MIKKKPRYTPRDSRTDSVFLTGTKVMVGEGDRAFDKAMRIFSRKVSDSKKLLTLREKEFFEKPSQKRKRKKSMARKRHLTQKAEASLRPTYEDS